MKKIINMCDKLINQVMSLIDNSYKDFGNKSKVIKPMRVIGKKYITIGKNVIINNGIRLEAIDKWLDETYDPEIIINDGVAIGQNCHITAANRIFIGRGSSIMPDVLITDIEHMYIQGKSLSETNIEVGLVEIGEFVTIGMGARIIGHRKLHIGDNAVIGANSVVTKDIPDNTVAVGVPARIIK
ncbi:acyltransferase [Schaedlerella arabinosiphila]|jgi:acetyltransferase-like isoleucine patch superfamily enzyme|uniref:Acyltransferase n=1 Tax=Schaedlerella arabinosiphila TaxID=2044587 RepID=A0A3R8JNM4_9FIRM|nr:acyltransferase [Schaedlerella arabinosiphila]RRK32483.1 acyltransferase [Schaedlerella arabinosiphila]